MQLEDDLYSTGESSAVNLDVTSNLTVQQQQQLQELMGEFPAIFRETPGRTTVTEHEIHVGDAAPISAEALLGAVFPARCGEARTGRNDGGRSDSTLHQPMGLTNCFGGEERWWGSVLRGLSKTQPGGQVRRLSYVTNRGNV